MKPFVLPAFDSYPSASSEMTEIVQVADVCIAKASKFFPEAVETLQAIKRRWQWIAMDPCYQLQLVVDYLLDEQDQASFHWPAADNGYEVAVEVVKDGQEAPASLAWYQNRIEKEPWQGPVPMAATTTIGWDDPSTGPCHVKLQSFSSALRWQCTETIGSETHSYELEYMLWDDVASFYARMMLPKTIDAQIQLDDASLYALPQTSPDLSAFSESDIIDFWSDLFDLRGFRGIGDTVDELVIGQLMRLFAQSPDSATLQIMAPCLTRLLGPMPTNGDYGLKENMQWFELSTPDGCLKWTSGTKHWSLDGRLLSNDDACVSSAAATLALHSWSIA